MYSLIKRFFDFIFSLAGLVLLSPLLIPVIIILLLTGEHEVFYFQKSVFNTQKFVEVCLS